MSMMTLANMSLVAVPLIALIAVIRFLTLYKLPKKTFNILWIIVLCSLLIPFNLFSWLDVSAHIGIWGDRVKEILIKMPEITDIEPIAEDLVTTVDATDLTTDMSIFYNIFDAVDRFSKEMYDRLEMLNYSNADIITGTAESTANNFTLNISPLLLIWLAGFLLCAAYFIFTHIKFRRLYAQSLPIDNTFVRAWRVEYSDSMRRKVRIRQSDFTNSPLTYGIFKPVILLPCNSDYSDEKNLRYILFHEYTHIRHFDTLLKLLLAIVLCLYWFNPFVWVMYILANRDIELSCDEEVVRKLMTSENVKSDYALALIRTAEKKSLIALSVSFNKNNMKERINSIMKIPKKSKMRIITAVILVSIVFVMLGTLQSCENNLEEMVYETYLDEGGELQTRAVEVVYTPTIDENFIMQEKTDKLVLYTYSMNSFTLTPAINIFKERYPDIEVEVKNISDAEYATILSTELAAGQGPDLVFSLSNSFPDIYKTMLTDIFVDINQFILRDDEFSMDKYNEAVLSAGIYQGKQYIFPIEYGVPLLLTTQEILDEEGIALTDLGAFDSFIRIAEQYNEKYKNNINKSVFINWHTNLSNLRNFFPRSGIDMINYQTNTVIINESKFKSIMALMKSMYTSKEDRALANAVGSSAMSLDSMKEQYWLFNSYYSATNLILFNLYGLLRDDGLTPLFIAYPNINNGVTAEVQSFAAIPKTSKNQINAYNLLKILLSEDIQGGQEDGEITNNYLRLGVPVLKSAVKTKIKQDDVWGDLDEETINKYANMMINVDSAKIMPQVMSNFIIEEMTPYFEDIKSFDDCYARLVNRLEIYKDE